VTTQKKVIEGGILKSDELESLKSKSGELKMDEPTVGIPVHFKLSTFGF
jgi:hypothetical protein